MYWFEFFLVLPELSCTFTWWPAFTWTSGWWDLLPPWIWSIFLASYSSVACIYIFCHFRNFEVPVFECVRRRKLLHMRIWSWEGLEKGSRYLDNLLGRTGLTKCFLILQFQQSCLQVSFWIFSPSSTLFLKSLWFVIQCIYYCCGTF